MSWIQKILPRTQTSTKGNVPEGIWTKCGSCQAVLYKSELEKLQEEDIRVKNQDQEFHFRVLKGVKCLYTEDYQKEDLQIFLKRILILLI